MSAIPRIEPLPQRFRLEAYDHTGEKVRGREASSETRTLASAVELLADERVFEVIAHDSSPLPGQWWVRIRYRRSTRHPGQIEVRQLPPTQEF